MTLRRSSVLALAVAASLLAAAFLATSAHALTLASQTYQLSGADTKQRLTVRCPGKKALPYSGGMLTDPLGPNGEGVYPHSYERLGVQRGWHVTPVLYSPTLQRSRQPLRHAAGRLRAAARSGQLSPQHGLRRPGRDPHRDRHLPEGNRLLAGGFQRTNFVTRGGNYVTESRAASDRSWQVSGSAFGNFGGELTAIAYCLKSGGPLVTEVVSQTTLPVEDVAPQPPRRPVRRGRAWSPAASPPPPRAQRWSHPPTSTRTGAGPRPPSTSSARTRR